MSRELSDSRLFRGRLVDRPVGGDSAQNQAAERENLTSRLNQLPPDWTDGPTAQLPYALLVQAMAARGVQAVAQGVLAKREQLILLRVDQQNLLLMTVLKYAAQVRSPAPFAEQLSAAPPPAAEERALAETLVDQRTCREFDLARYQDQYTEKLWQLIEAKVNGRSLPAAEEHEPGQVLSLMQALGERGSAGAGRRPGSGRAKKGERAKSARSAKSRRGPRRKAA